MKKSYLLAVLIITFVFSGALAQNKINEPDKKLKSNLEIKNGWYYLNGQKFFVNALGYEIGAQTWPASLSKEIF